MEVSDFEVLVNEVAGQPNDPSEIFFEKLNSKTMLDNINSLKPQYKESVLAYFLGEKSIEAIAKSIGVSRPEVYRRIRTGVRDLQRMYNRSMTDTPNISGRKSPLKRVTTQPTSS